MKLKLGFSSCPNDTFMFDALVHRRIDCGEMEYEVKMADIFHLNQMAMRGEMDMVKISYNTYGQIRDRYHLLDAGSALGYKCGPLLISKELLTVEEIVKQNLPVAIPGKNTTANLLLGFYAPKIQNKVEVIFHEVMPKVLSGEAAAGLIIHENRFTYQDLGLRCIQDLGEYWEEKTSLPIPLGAIVAKKSLGMKIINELEQQMRESVAYAFNHPEKSQPYIREYAQEMDPKVMQAHIDLYVNQFSVSLGKEGRRAVGKVLDVGREMGFW